MRRVHKDGRASLDRRERVDHRDGMRDRRQIVLLPLADDQFQRIRFRSAWRRRDHRLDVVVLLAGHRLDRLDGLGGGNRAGRLRRPQRRTRVVEAGRIAAATTTAPAGRSRGACDRNDAPE